MRQRERLSDGCPLVKVRLVDDDERGRGYGVGGQPLADGLRHAKLNRCVRPRVALSGCDDAVADACGCQLG